MCPVTTAYPTSHSTTPDHVSPAFTKTETSIRHAPEAPLLMPGTLVVRRGDGLQVGLAPDRALEVTGGAGLSPYVLAEVLGSLDGRHRLERVTSRYGLDSDGHLTVERVVRRLAALGHVSWPSPPNGESEAHSQRPLLEPVNRVLLIGGGQLAQALRSPLNVNGCRVRGIREPGLELDPDRPPWRSSSGDDDLVILADQVVPDPVLTDKLVGDRQPHLHVYARDGRVVVGPTVVPGQTSCLRCAHLFRADHDPQWPQVAARLLGMTTTASAPSLHAGMSLVLSEILASRGGPGIAQTLGATVEISPGEGLWSRREWPVDQRCVCG